MAVRWRRSRPFQSTRPCGAGPEVRRHDDVPIAISIHPPLRGGTAPVLAALHSVSFQSTRPCGAGHSAPALKNPWKYFNPPALAGRDEQMEQEGASREISIHPLLAGRDRTVRANVLRQPFQSTRPLRGGTPHTPHRAQSPSFQSTRPLRGGTAGATCTAAAARFQSTRPLRGGTC